MSSINFLKNKPMILWTEQERCLFFAYGILRECYIDAECDNNYAKAAAYEGAIKLIEAAVNADWEALNRGV